MEDRTASSAARLQFKFERPLRVPQRQLDSVVRRPQPKLRPYPDVVPVVQKPVVTTPAPALSSLFSLDVADQTSSLRIKRRFRPTRSGMLIGLAGAMLALSLYLNVTAWMINSRVQAQAAPSSTATSSPGSDPQVADSNRNITETPITNLAAYKVLPTSPRFIFIDKLHIQARILKLGIGSDGALQTPRNSYDTGWYTESANPGDNGAMLVDGHALGPTKPGVFHDIKTLRPGDPIRIERGDGKSFTYIVNKVDILNAKDVPMDKLLVPIKPGTKGLNLISCTGTYNEKNETFNERAIVYASMQ